MKLLLACVLLLSTSSVLAQQLLRAEGALRVQRGSTGQAFASGATIKEGDRLSANAFSSRAELGWGEGRVVLGGDSELYFHSSEKLENGLSLLRLALNRGVLRIQGAGAQGLDLRLNLGGVRLRAAQADFWAAVEPQGETVCLLAGSLDIAADYGNERLDTPGDCLLFSATNRRLVLRPNDPEVMARKLARTALAEPVPAPVPPAPLPVELPSAPVQQPPPVAAAEPVPVLAPAPEPLPTPEPLPESAPTTATPAPAERPTPAPTARWTIVVGALGSEAAAERLAARLRAEGDTVAIAPHQNLWRVLVGQHSSLSVAAEARAALLLRFPGAWVLAQ